MDDPYLGVSLKRFLGLSEALRDLEQVGPLDPVWDLLKARLPELSDLVQRKLAERIDATAKQNETRKLIQNAIKQVVEKHRRLIEFLEIRKIESIGCPVCLGDDKVARAMTIVSEVGSLLSEYEEYEKANPANRTERHAIETRKNGIEGHLDELVDELSVLLSPAGTELSVASSILEPKKPVQELAQDQSIELEEEGQTESVERASVSSLGDEPETPDVGDPAASDRSVDTECIMETVSVAESEDAMESTDEDDTSDDVSIVHAPSQTDSADVPETPEIPPPEPCVELAQDSATDAASVTSVESFPEKPSDESDFEIELSDVSWAAGQRIAGEDQVWQYFGQARFSEAYWLSYGLSSDDGKDLGPLSDVLFACALQGGVAVHSRDDCTVDLFTELLRVYQRVANPVDALANLEFTTCEAAMLAVTASLAAALFEPASGALGWLQQGARSHIPCAGTVDLLVEFAANAAWMGLKELIGREGVAAEEDEMREIRKAAARWLEAARTTRFTYVPARSVMRYLAAPNGPLGSLMEAISGDRQSAVADERFRTIPSTDAECNEYIERALKKVGMPGVGIAGESRNRIVRLIREASAIQRRYESLLKPAPSAESRSHRESELRKFVKTINTRLSEEPDTWALGSERARAIANGLRAEIHRVVSLLAGQSAPNNRWLSDLRAPLLRLNEVPVIPGVPLPERLSLEESTELAKALARSLPWREVALLHARRKDFHAASLVVEHLKSVDTGEVEEVSKQIDDLYLEARREIGRQLEELRNAIEEATIDSTLSEQDKSGFDSIVLGIENSTDLRICRLLEELHEWREDLSSRRLARAAALREHLNELNEEIASSEQNAISEAAARYAEKAAIALGNNDSLLADEYIGRAEDILRTRTNVIEPDDEKQGDEDWAAQFMEVAENLRDALDKKGGEDAVRSALIRGQSIAGISTGGLLGTRRNEIQEALNALAFIKSAPKHGPKAKDRRNLHHDITKIMAYLGFLDVGNVQSVKGGEGYQHFRVKVGLTQRSPLPQFGSGLNGTCDVVVVWDRPDEHTLAALLRQLGVKNPLVLYLGRMTRKQRRDWGALCRETRLTALVVDDVLLHFLAGQSRNRLHACVSCAMLWGYANPYSFSGPIVPPEMFQGRDKVIHEIEDSLGSAVLYGGRQLGKSACLRQFARKYHEPELNHYVVYRDIKQVGKPGADSSPSAVWKYIAQGLYEVGFPISARATADDIVRAVKTQMGAKPDLRIWVLLDEADDFLRVDATSRKQAPFTVVQQLKDLMDSTERRFKVVFSGLHSVQKYSTIPNHPFAHFKAPIVIGPLDHRSGIRLIKEPLSALGFRFPSNDPVYRILAYTNSHPALIQLFCSELVNMNTRQAPPHVVTTEMVEMVFRNPEVRARMRERFEWTLDLDDRYAVLAYAIIDAQRDIQDGYRREFSVEDCLLEAREAWPAAFNSIDEEECRSLLDELTGLGILVRTSGGYRLRNANIVTALGSKSEVQDRLRMFAQKEPPTKETALDRRSRYEDSDGWRPLTLAQEATLLKNRNRVSLIFGSEALGLDRLEDGLKEVFAEKTEKGERDIHCVIPECATLGSLENWLRGRLASRGTPTLVPVPAKMLMLFPEPLTDVISGVNEVLEEGSAKSQVVLTVLFDPSDIAQWHRLPQAERDTILAVVGQPLVIRKWEAHALEMMLRDEGLLGNPSVVEAVRKATGGWPSLLHQIYASPHHRDHSDIRPEALALREAIVKEPRRGRQFISSTGLKAIPFGEELARFVAEIEPIQPGDIDLMESPEIAPEVKIASFRALIDLGIIEPEPARRRKAKTSDAVEKPTALVVDPLVKEILVARKTG